MCYSYYMEGLLERRVHDENCCLTGAGILKQGIPTFQDMGDMTPHRLFSQQYRDFYDVLI